MATKYDFASASNVLKEIYGSKDLAKLSYSWPNFVILTSGSGGSSQHLWYSSKSYKTPLMNKLAKTQIISNYSFAVTVAVSGYPYNTKCYSQYIPNYESNTPAFGVELWHGPVSQFQIPDEFVNSNGMEYFYEAHVTNYKCMLEEALFKNPTMGLAAWLPYAVPGFGRLRPNDNFHGINRNVDTVRLAGNYAEGSNPIEVLVYAMTLCAREDGKPKDIFVSPSTWSTIAKGNIYSGVEVIGEVMMIHGLHGSSIVHMSPECPDFLAYVLDLDTWKIYHRGPDVGEIIYANDPISSQKNITITSEFALTCSNPGHNAVCMLENIW